MSLEYYVINFYASGKTLINTKNHRKELLEKKVPDPESVYGIIFQIKGRKFSCDASRLELTNQSEAPGCSNFDVRDMAQNQCFNKNKLMLTIKNKTELDNSKTGDGKQILNTVVNTSENLNTTKTQVNSNRTITVFSRKCIETEN